MKTKSIIISCLLTLVTMLSAQAQTLTIDNASAQAGGELELTVKASNVNSYIATGFYVELPNGFSAAGVTATKSSGLQSDHVVKAGTTSDTKLRVAIYSTKNSALSIASSPLCTLKLTAPSKAGTYTGRITGVEFSNANHNLSPAATKTFTITVVNNNPLPGDVNDDQAVDVADIATIISVMSGSSIADNADVNGDGAVDVADIATVISIMAGQTVIIPGDNGHEPAGVEAIDLGLPSGTKWANMNVGAEKPSDYGLYFAWGETKGYATASSNGRQFNWASYKWMNSGQSTMEQINKYQVADGETAGCWYSGNTFIGDGSAQLELADDAAHANWGGEWVMPNKAEFEELLKCTTSEWTTVNGINGRKLTSKNNGKSIFLPAAGEGMNKEINGQNSYGAYWSSSIDKETYSANVLCPFESNLLQMGMPRYCGYSVRPVIRGDKTPDDVNVEAVDLGLPSGTKWANMNVGAKSPSDIGNYYAWGETEVKSEYSWDTYMYGNSYNDVVNIGTDIGGTTYDVAKTAWGGSWRIPSNAQWNELLENCDWEWTFLTSTDGVKLTSKKNGNSIFLPTTGVFGSQTLLAAHGYYWSSMLTSDMPRYAWVADFASSGIKMYDRWVERYFGVPVRPVQ